MAVPKRVLDAIGWRMRRAGATIGDLPDRLTAWRQYKKHVADYTFITEEQLKASRKSDTVFIFGSGASLNSITAAEWTRISQYDTIGFNWFVHQAFVRCDYHLVREVVPHELKSDWRNELQRYFRLLRDNARFENTIVLIQAGLRAVNANRAIGLQLMPSRLRLFPFRTFESALPSPSFATGLAHGEGTLTECVNFAALAGWKNIVIAGVDLYDRRYFWRADSDVDADGAPVEQPHRTVAIVDTMRQWRAYYEARGVSLFVYNPRSLLTAALPQWTWPA